MPPEFHLRLLCALCNDVVNCYNMKAEIAGRYVGDAANSCKLACIAVS